MEDMLWKMRKVMSIEAVRMQLKFGEKKIENKMIEGKLTSSCPWFSVAIGCRFPLPG